MAQNLADNISQKGFIDKKTELAEFIKTAAFAWQMFASADIKKMPMADYIAERILFVYSVTYKDKIGNG